MLFGQIKTGTGEHDSVDGSTVTCRERDFFGVGPLDLFKLRLLRDREPFLNRFYGVKLVIEIANRSHRGDFLSVLTYKGEFRPVKGLLRGLPIGNHDMLFAPAIWFLDHDFGGQWALGCCHKNQPI